MLPFDLLRETDRLARGARYGLSYFLALWACMFAVNTMLRGEINLPVEFVVIGALIAASLAVSWHLTRHFAPASRLRTGNFYAWVGWGLISILPTIPWLLASLEMFPEYGDLAESRFWWLDAIGFSALGALGLSFAAYSTGRAIDGSRVRFGAFWQSMKPVAIPGTVAYFFLLFPHFALSNYVDWTFTDEAIGGGARLLANAAASLVEALFWVWEIALSVLIFLKVDRTLAD